MRVVLLFIVLMTAWLLMSGHYTGLIISLGVASVLFCVWLSHAIGATDQEGLPTHLFARLPAYLLWLVGEIVKSNYATAKFILNGRADPEIFTVSATQKTAAGIATYANSITLTPGTVTVDIDEHADKDQFLVHALHGDFGDDVRSNDMDRRVTALDASSSQIATKGDAV
jgi:multicomponent Na+:H+ antiporter subunit E